jgi:dinuclear metal center YbgI/SA1388 family protein
MAKLKEIKAFLESLIPPSLQDSWDNSGLQVGWEEQEVKVAGFALSVTLSVIEEAKAKGVDLIITHHPLTLSGIKALVPDAYPSKLFLELARSSISVYALHTNLDVSPFGPTAYIAEELGLVDCSPIVDSPPYGAVGRLEEPLSQEEFLKKLRSVLARDVCRCVNFKPEAPVERVAVCSGSGGSFVRELVGKVDLFVTGDLKYHDALVALDCGLTVVDAGHFGTERLFFRKLQPLLAQSFPSVNFLILDETSPFEVCDVER